MLAKSFILSYLIFTSSVFAIIECKNDKYIWNREYYQARNMLINSGYIADLPEISIARGTIPPTYTLIQYKADGFREVAACMDTKDKNCIFLFKKDNEKLTVTTYGYPGRIKNIERCRRIK